MPSHRQRIYLAYGSNLHPRRLQARIGAVQSLGVVELPGWSLRFDKRGGDGSAKANLRPAPGVDCRAIAALFALRSDQVRKLDEFEGCGHGYETISMSIRQGAEQLAGFTYIAPSQWISADLLPFDWYVDLIVAGARFHGFDEGYLRRIADSPSCRDPDRQRARSELTDLHLPLPPHYKR